MSDHACNAARNAARNDEPDSRPFQELPTSPAPGRNADGTFTPGNVAALRHGAYSRQVQAGALDAQAEARAALREREAAIVSDLGGPDTVSVLQRDAVARYVGLSLVEDYLTRAIVDRGPLTPKGRQRAALTALLQVSDRLQRIAQMLGVDRRAKPAITDPVVWLQEGQR
jgi:hypothetical protein